MFNGIAGSYDRLNHIMSFGVDRIWRRKAVKTVVGGESSLEILDLACGTGDSAIALARRLPQGHVTGVDLSEGMLSVMREKVERRDLGDKISMERGDGEKLHFEDGRFDRATIFFGIRNFESKTAGLREMLRVLKPGGRVVILELSRPENAVLRSMYNVYFLHILPWIGGKLSGNRAAYNYLPASVVAFPAPEEFMAMMTAAGFEKVEHKAYSLGLCRMYTGEKRKFAGYE